MAYLLGQDVRLIADLTDPALMPEAAATLSWLVRDPTGVENDRSGAVTNPSLGIYQLDVIADTVGIWHWRLITTGNVAVAEGRFQVEDNYSVIPDPTAPTDLHVLVPRARRYCEGPYGAPQGKPALSDSQLYSMVADALSDIILVTGNLFHHKIIVTGRDKTAGFPIGWATECVLDEWECSIITTQVALNYFFFVFRDMKISESLKNEGTEWSYALSANVIRDYIANLQATRDMAINGLRLRHPVIDRFASNIRVRDQATVAVLEWWAGEQGGGIGLPGGQEAYTIPFIPGWFPGSGFGG